MAIFMIFFYKNLKLKLDTSALPKELRLFYANYYKSSSSWTKEGTTDFTWYRKQLVPGTEMWEQMSAIFKDYCEGEELIVSDAYAVYNPALVSSFIAQLKIIKNRMEVDPVLFKQKSFLLEENSSLKEWVYKKFEARIYNCPWNSKDLPVIMPVVYGTSLTAAWKICATGFANLSCNDDGFFGKGIYFTTYAINALPYFSTKEQPSIVISYALPGNTFPVTENSQGPNSRIGTSIVGGYNSHYAVTLPSGEPPEEPVSTQIYDQLVIPQEAQVTPAIVLKIEPRNLSSLSRRFLSVNRRLMNQGDEYNTDNEAISLEDSLLG
eukprot:TRINITY_DN1156_c0_g1_i1.p1 TRINITY_DN1156_c0_g1~~TRINITY_DN1156_c0_g1_i1.p1  ORF type:complete len:322 (-),score=65.30 TRINITY_DN1156_c0_g1_i1:81-1046(-)